MPAPVDIIFRSKTGEARTEIGQLRESIAELRGSIESMNRESAHSTGNLRSSRGEISKLERGAIAGSGALSHLGRSLAFASTAFIGTAELSRFVKESIGGAIDLGRQMYRTNVVFGEASTQVKAWSKTTADAMGLSSSEALTVANNFGQMLKPIGVAPKRAAEMSEQFAKLANDLATLRGADPSEVLQKLTVAFSGRTRALRQYGIFIDETRVKAEALRLGLLKGSVDQAKVNQASEAAAIAQAKYNDALKQYGPNSTQAASAHLTLERAQGSLSKSMEGTTGTLTNQQRVMAIYSLVTHDAAYASDTFEKRQGTLSVQSRKLHAEIADLQEEIGTALIPTVKTIVGHMLSWVKQLNESESAHAQFRATLHQIGTVARVTGDLIVGLGRAASFVAREVHGWRNAAVLLFAIWTAQKLSAEESILMRLVGVISQLRAGTIAWGVAAREAALTSGIGALIVIAAEIVLHWKTVKRYLDEFFVWLRQKALETALDVVEPFSHLPGKLGAWARKAKDNIQEQLGNLELQQAASKGADEFGRVFAKRIQQWAKNAGQTISDTMAATMAQEQAPLGPNAAPSTGKAATLVNTAVTAGRSPGAGSAGFHLKGERAPYDCSAFVQAVFKNSGLPDPGGTTYTQWANGKPVAMNDLLPGDLIFFTYKGERRPGHVAIYVGNGKIVHDHGSSRGVQIQTLASMGTPDGARCFLTGKGGGHTHRDARAAGGATGADQKPDPVVAEPAADTTPADTTGPLHVGKTTKKAAAKKKKRLADVGAGLGLQLDTKKLTPAQQKVAEEIFRLAVSHGLTTSQALELVAAAYNESGLDPNVVNKIGAFGLFQFYKNPNYEKAYRWYRAHGYSIVDAETLAILLPAHGSENDRTYAAYFKAHPNADPGEAAAYVERSGEGAAFYRKGIGSLFQLSKAGTTTPRKPSARDTDTPMARIREVATESGELFGLSDDLNRYFKKGLIDPTTYQYTKDQLANVRKMIKDAFKDGIITKAERDAIATAFGEVQSSIVGTLKDLQLDTIRMRDIGKTFKKLIADGILDDAELDTLDGKLGQLQSSLKDHLLEITKTIRDARAQMDEAWGRIVDILRQAYDTQVTGRVARLRSFGQNALTRATAVKAGQRAEGTISSLETAGVSPVMATIREKGQALVDAYARFVASMKGASTGVTSGQNVGAAGAGAGTGGTTLTSNEQDEVDRSAAALAEAQDQWDSLAGDWTDVETQYHDAWGRKIDAAKTLADDALDKYQSDYEAKAKLKFAGIQKNLNTIYAAVRSGKITWEQALPDIQALLASVGLTMADLGNALDTSDLQSAISGLAQGDSDLIVALADLKTAIEGLANALGVGDAAPGASGGGRTSASAPGPGGGGVQPAPDMGVDASGRPYTADNNYRLARGFSRGGIVGDILYASSGAYVRGYRPQGTDTVPAMLTPGEVVLNAAEEKTLAGRIGGPAELHVHVYPRGLVIGTAEEVGKAVADPVRNELTRIARRIPGGSAGLFTR